MRWLVAPTFASAMLGGCFEPDVKQCANGVTCPSSLACTETDDFTKTLCGPEEEVAACAGLAERDACASSAVPDGYCEQAICMPCSVDKFYCRYSEWKRMTSPTGNDLASVWVAAANRAYAVGFRVLLTYDGETWAERSEYSTLGSFTDIWGAAADDVFITTGSGLVYRNTDLVSTSEQTAQNKLLQAIWGGAPDNVIAVGAGDETGEYDGSDWTWQRRANFGLPFYDVTGIGTKAFVVTEGVAYVRSGTTWASMAAPPNTPRGIWAVSENDLFAVGDKVVGTESRGVIHRYNGSTWSPIDVGSVPPLKGVWAASANDVWAVGSGGIVIHYDGSSWTTTMLGVDLNAVYGVGPDVFAVGPGGAIFRYHPPRP